MTEQNPIELQTTGPDASAKPLQPVSEISDTKLPHVHIPPGKVEALSIYAIERAKSFQGNLSEHEKGIFGEYALALHLGIPDEVDKEIYEGGDGGIDLEYRGKKIDVKTVGQYENNPCLKVSTGDLRAEFYVLIQMLNRTNYRIYGYAHRRTVRNSPIFTFSRSKQVWPDKYGNQFYLVEQDRLLHLP